MEIGSVTKGLISLHVQINDIGKSGKRFDISGPQALGIMYGQGACVGGGGVRRVWKCFQPAADGTRRHVELDVNEKMFSGTLDPSPRDKAARLECEAFVVQMVDDEIVYFLGKEMGHLSLRLGAKV